jgi:thiamine biosynthesis protein ThiI
MKEILLAKCGELVLKGLNRGLFERAVMDNIKRRLAPIGQFSVRSAQSTIYIEPHNNDDIEEGLTALQDVFGIVSISRAAVCRKDIKEILETAGQYLTKPLSDVQTFKVEAKRSDKQFPLTSPEIMNEAGGKLLSVNPHLKVDVHNPQLTVYIEIRDFGAYIHAGRIPGAGGMPIGTGGKAVLLLSGGIDSPVAGYMMAKRGIELTAVHFFSHPYTSERAKEKVLELGRKMCRYCGRLNVFVVPFTHIQEEIKRCCNEEYFTIIMRRYMMKIAAQIAQNEGAQALITGESLGQVASQTIGALSVTNEAAGMLVFRPLIGMDKEEIITVSRKIDTFETSILPYEDCCTVFTPRHPRTKPILSHVLRASEKLNEEELINEALDGIETIGLKLNN